MDHDKSARTGSRTSAKVSSVPGLAIARRARGWSQRDLGERCGLMPAAVSHYESGERAPSVENLLQLADALEISVDQLLGRKATVPIGPRIHRLVVLLGRVESRDLDILLAEVEAMAKTARAPRGES